MPNLRSDERSVLGSARTFGPKALSVQHYPPEMAVVKKIRYYFLVGFIGLNLNYPLLLR